MSSRRHAYTSSSRNTASSACTNHTDTPAGPRVAHHRPVFFERLHPHPRALRRRHRDPRPHIAAVRSGVIEQLGLAVKLLVTNRSPSRVASSTAASRVMSTDLRLSDRPPAYIPGFPLS